MSVLEIIILSFTICIDSFILCLLINTKNRKQHFLIPFIFSLFQVVFLYTGLMLGNIIEMYLASYLKYVIFLIYSFMALRLIVDTILNKDSGSPSLISLKVIVIQAISTSFDSLFIAFPISFSTNNINFIILIVGIVTFVLCFFALQLQNKIKNNSSDIYNILGAIILFIFAFKSLI